jgi:exopolysaccharide biosynthesis polyprenyl glycosylphosphotransferase
MLDLAAVTGALLVAYEYRFHASPVPIPGGEPPDSGPYLAAIPVVDLIALVAFTFTRMYRYRRSQPALDELFAVMGSLGLTTVGLLAISSLYRGFSYSRLVMFYLLIFAVILVTLERFSLRTTVHALRRRGIGCERALVVGGGPGAEMLVRRMQMFPEYGHLVVGVVDDPPSPEVLAGVPVLGARVDLERICGRHRIDEVFLAIPHGDHQEMLDLIDACDRQGVQCKIMPAVLELITTRVDTDDVEGIPLIGLRQVSLDGSNAAVKRAVDLVMALAFLTLASPLMALIAGLVKLSSPGPVLIRQERLGVNGSTFDIYKFRSMRADAERGSGPVFATPQDPRVTPIGRIIRRLSLDELPQLWNVLRGDMSLVGPRPERPHFVEQFAEEIPRYYERHRVRPGLTGWAQVNDLRGNTPIDERTLYDLYYVENWSLAFDLRIILTTLFRIFIHQHAY